MHLTRQVGMMMMMVLRGRLDARVVCMRRLLRNIGNGTVGERLVVKR